MFGELGSARLGSACARKNGAVNIPPADADDFPVLAERSAAPAGAQFDCPCTTHLKSVGDRRSSRQAMEGARCASRREWSVTLGLAWNPRRTLRRYQGVAEVPHAPIFSHYSKVRDKIDRIVANLNPVHAKHAALLCLSRNPRWASPASANVRASSATLGRRDFYRHLCHTLGLHPTSVAANLFLAVETHVQELRRDKVRIADGPAPPPELERRVVQLAADTHRDPQEVLAELVDGALAEDDEFTAFARKRWADGDAAVARGD